MTFPFKIDLGCALRAIATRIAGAAVGVVVGLVASKNIGAITPDSAQNIQEVLTNGLMLVGYGIGHKVAEHTKKK